MLAFDELMDLNLTCVECGAGRVDSDLCNSCHVLKRLTELRDEIELSEDAEFLEYLYGG